MDACFKNFQLERKRECVTAEYLWRTTVARIRRARDGNPAPEDELRMERYLNPPFLKYAEKLGYERYLAVNTLESLGDNMTTDSLLEAVLKSYEASLPRSTDQWLYYQTLGRPAFSINFDRFQILYITPECNIRNPNHPIYMALESALHNLTPGGYLRPRRPSGYHHAGEQT